MSEKMNQFFASSWRVNDLQIGANEIGVQTFIDSKPNMFVIQNPNDATLKISIAGMPTDDKYEFLVGANSTETIGRPIATGSLNILNTTNKVITVRIFSVFDRFDMNVLKNLHMTIQNAQFSAAMTISGFGTGVMLPAGSNTIGNVEYGTNAKTLVQSIKDTLSGCNTRLDEVLTFPSTTWKTTIENTSPISVQNTEKGVSDFLSFEYTDSTGSATIVFADESVVVNFLNLLANDGTTDIKVTFYKDAETLRVFTLKEGESISDMPIGFYGIGIAPKVDGEAISWRFLGSVK